MAVLVFLALFLSLTGYSSKQLYQFFLAHLFFKGSNQPLLIS